MLRKFPFANDSFSIDFDGCPLEVLIKCFSLSSCVILFILRIMRFGQIFTFIEKKLGELEFCNAAFFTTNYKCCLDRKAEDIRRKRHDREQAAEALAAWEASQITTAVEAARAKAAAEAEAAGMSMEAAQEAIIRATASAETAMKVLKR